MALLSILNYPDPRLRLKAATVTVFDEALATLAKDMAETMYDAKGVGLAAIQVNVQQSVIVVDVSDTRDQLITLVNPVIQEKSGEVWYEEGCLSVPHFFEKVKRAAMIVVNYQDVTGAQHTVRAEELLAICIQHEMDHLIGKVFVDYLSYTKRMRFEKLLMKKKAS